VLTQGRLIAFYENGCKSTKKERELYMLHQLARFKELSLDYHSQLSEFKKAITSKDPLKVQAFGIQVSVEHLWAAHKVADDTVKKVLTQLIEKHWQHREAVEESRVISKYYQKRSFQI
jgi:hypothetical protein